MAGAELRVQVGRTQYGAVVPPDCVHVTGEAVDVRSPSVLISSLQIGGGL